MNKRVMSGVEAEGGSQRPDRPKKVKHTSCHYSSGSVSVSVSASVSVSVSAPGSGFANGFQERPREEGRVRQQMNGHLENGSEREILGDFQDQDQDQDQDLDDDSDLEEEEEEEGRLTSDVGIVESVSLTNFMCHSHFKIDFGPRINFVIGKNGSGKSAVLTGIVVGLGGRASATNRGQAIKSFIKSGCSYSKICIKLCNKGREPSLSFKPKEYGDSIIVERTLRIEGNSTYNLKSSKGKIVSNKKEELDNMIRKFRIQIDNPVCILTQEISRNFLNSKNPRDKYNFFMKATLLDQLKSDYALAIDQAAASRDTFEEKKAILPEVEKELKKLKRKVNLLESCTDLKGQLNGLKGELLWSAVFEKESEANVIGDEIEDRSKRIGLATERVSELDEELARLSNRKKELTHSVNLLLSEVDSERNEIAQKKAALSSDRRDRQVKMDEVRRHDSEIRVIERDEKMLRSKIKDLRSQLSDQNKIEEERRQRTIQIEALESRLQANKTSQRNLEEKRKDVFYRGSERKEEYNSVVKDIEGAKSSLQRKQVHLRNIEQSRSNSMRRFGRFMPDLLRDIDEAHKTGKLSKKPLGPIGSFIKLKEPSSALAIESCLSRLLRSFCSDNMADTRVLEAIMRKLNLRHEAPDIITRTFKRRHDVSRNKVVSDEYRSFYDLIDIENDPVANVLIDKASIETTLYVPNAKARAARDLLLHASSVPRNCRQAFTQSGDNMYPATSYQTFRSYPGRKQSPDMLTEDVEQAIDEVNNEIRSLRTQIGDLESKRVEMGRVMTKFLDELKIIEVEKKKLQGEYKTLNAEQEELKNVEERNPVEIEVLEEEIFSLGKEKAQIEEEKSQKQQLANMMSELMKEKEFQLQEKEDQFREKMEKQKPVTDEVNQISGKISKAEDRLKDCQKRLDEMTQKQAEVQQKHKKALEVVRMVTEKAVELHPERKDTRKTVETLNREITQVESLLSEKEREAGNREEILMQYKEQSERHESTKAHVIALEKFLTGQEEALDTRKRKYLELRRDITNQAESMFLLILKQMHFEGSLHVYHKDQQARDGQPAKKEKTLEIKINPKIKANSQVYNDTRSLSGGERSFSTVAFLLALWESCYAPFRILDEVDVFMDMITRTVAMDCLVETAKQKSGKQYIFLSPLPLIKDNQHELISIFHMPDPERKAPSSTPSSATT